MSQVNVSKRSQDREERIAASMRENLKRRKEQQRAREQKQQAVQDNLESKQASKET